MAGNDAVVPAAENMDLDLSVHPSGIVPQLQNVVATVNLGVALDLKAIALHARNAEYNPKRFAAVIMRIREPKTTALIFASGKMVCTGAKSEEDSKMAARKYCKIIIKLGFQATFKEFKIQNIVGSCDVKFPIRLEGLAVSSQLFCTYEPELFPGLIYRMKEPKIVLLIFVSGKIVLTGAKQRKEIYEAFENIYPILQEFRKGDAAMLPPAPAPAPAAQQPAGMLPPAPRSRAQPASNLPPPTPAHTGLPPPTPMTGLPPATPAHPGLPPPTPSHHGLPPATPAYEGVVAGQFAPALPK